MRYHQCKFNCFVELYQFTSTKNLVWSLISTLHILQTLYKLPVNGYFSVFPKNQTILKYSVQRDKSVFVCAVCLMSLHAKWIAPQAGLNQNLPCLNRQISQYIILSQLRPNQITPTLVSDSTSLCLSVYYTDSLFIFFHCFCTFAGCMGSSGAIPSKQVTSTSSFSVIKYGISPN